MATMSEILEKHRALHKDLGRRKDAPDKEEFDEKHRKLWADCDNALIARRTELLAKGELTVEESKEAGELKEILRKFR